MGDFLFSRTSVPGTRSGRYDRAKNLGLFCTTSIGRHSDPFPLARQSLISISGGKRSGYFDRTFCSTKYASSPATGLSSSSAHSDIASAIGFGKLIVMRVVRRDGCATGLLVLVPDNYAADSLLYLLMQRIRCYSDTRMTRFNFVSVLCQSCFTGGIGGGLFQRSWSFGAGTGWAFLACWTLYRVSLAASDELYVSALRDGSRRSPYLFWPVPKTGIELRSVSQTYY